MNKMRLLFLLFVISTSILLAQKNEPAENKYGTLYFSKNEIAGIQEIIGGDIITKGDLTKAQLLEKIVDYDIIHLATHTETDNDNPLRSRFIISARSDSSEENISVYATDIFPLNLKAKLATLSSCNTGVGKLARGEGIMSLARAFKFAGCPSAVISLWEIDDISTAFIMKEFYGNLKNGEKKDVALRNAKLAYLKQSNSKSAAPVFWAGAVPIGNLNKMEFVSGFSPSGWLFVPLAFLFAIAVLVFFRKRNRLVVSAERSDAQKF